MFFCACRRQRQSFFVSDCACFFVRAEGIPVRQLVVLKIASYLLFDKWRYCFEEQVSVKFAFLVVKFAGEKVLVDNT